MEGWNVHSSAEDVYATIFKIFPILDNIHKQFKDDVLYVDFENIKYLFDHKGEIMPKRMNNRDPFWTLQRLFPINSLFNNEEILSIWDKYPNSTQSLDVVKKLMNLRGDKYIPILCCYRKDSVLVYKYCVLTINITVNNYSDLSLTADG